MTIILIHLNYVRLPLFFQFPWSTEVSPEEQAAFPTIGITEFEFPISV